MYGISNEYTMCMLDWTKWIKTKYSDELKEYLPRMLWLKKSWNMQEVHRYVFKVVRHCLSEWVDWADPQTTREPAKDAKRDLRDHMIEFPYRI